MSLTKGHPSAIPREISRVLIVDAQPLIRRGLAALITADAGFELCGEAPDTPSALHAVATESPDVVIVGLSLMTGGGLELIKHLKAIAPEIRILLASDQDDPLHALRALRAGARGYVSKSEPAEKTLEALRRVRDGRIYLSETLSDSLLRVTVTADKPVTSPYGLLSDREMEVFEMYGDGLTTADIGRQLHLSTKTIDTHRQRIKMKLELRSTNHLVCVAARLTR